MAYLGNGPILGAYTHVDDISSGFDGTAVTFNITKNSIAKSPIRAEVFLVSIAGIWQAPYDAYSVSGSTITFTEAPIAGSSFFGIILGDALNVGIIPDGAVTQDKLNANVVGTAEIIDGNVTGPKISNMSATDGQVLTFDTGNGWQPETIPSINTLNDISNVSVSSASTGQALVWNGSAWANSAIEAFNTQTHTTTSTSQAPIATFAHATTDAIKLVITADDSTNRSVTELVITHNGTTAFGTEYAQVNTNTALVDISGTNIRVLATPAAGTSTVFTTKAIVL